MYRMVFLLSILIMSFAFAQKKIEDIRILNLLPNVTSPPLVEPFLPADFILGEMENDPYFCSGYYWGGEGSLADYFEDPTTLKGCLIRAQTSVTVKQISHNRFSNDGNTQTLSAAGFTEIVVNKGKWGIFPYRELLAKGPKGKRYYQMWVGLNTDEGATLCFQFLYPEYLNEPTQTQKGIWTNFVKKTRLLSMNDLLVARGVSFPSDLMEEMKIEEQIGLKVEKRRSDQKLFIYLNPIQDFSVLEIKDNNAANIFPLMKSFVAIDALVTIDNGKSSQEKLQIPYKLVDQFSFDPGMLHPSRFHESADYLLFY